MRNTVGLIAAAGLVFMSTNAAAESISTHVLDLARGVGGANVPVTLEIKQADGTWKTIGTARTDENGRVREFGDMKVEQATYRLSFDISQYGDTGQPAFFPEIDVVFQVPDANLHYHVPVVVSPYGYSTYRGN